MPESGAGVVEVQLEALRDRPEADPLVNAVGVHALLSGVELHLVAVAELCEVDEVLEQSSACAASADRLAYDHVFDNGPRSGPVRQVRYDDQLGGAHDVVAVRCNAQMAGLVAGDRREHLTRSIGVCRYTCSVALRKLPIQLEQPLKVTLLCLANLK